MMKEEDAMVYRRPYLTSGSSGFALNAISKAMKRDLKVIFCSRVAYFCLALQLHLWFLHACVSNNITF